MSLQAANPRINATVTASAGSGKTYMLVTRIVRLLMDSAEPGGILAMTFTRKAAAEMQQRLTERLYQLATADDNKLIKLLTELDLDESYQQKARNLYEIHQYCDYPVRTLTFHSFCQDLLSRFPLEADVPPNFDLLESADLLIQQARDALFNEATLDMQGELAGHLQRLMQLSGGLFNLEKILNNFLHHRSDWWAFTDKQRGPDGNAVEFAMQHLANTLDYQPEVQPLELFFNNKLNINLQRFAKQLGQAAGVKNLQCADKLANWLVNKPVDESSFELIRSCFLTQKNEPLSAGRKDSKALRKKLNDDTDDFLETHQKISAQILSTMDLLNKQHTWELNQHWYYCGEIFVNHYQALKQQQRLLDFTDLEWRSYKLLQDSENAEWIQYKLDQKIQHLLIDEFQDTNPTQWQLILPLLEEMAAAESEQPRSIFLVGDEKQSIYSFRRAKPELQQQASNWLNEHLNAQAFPLNKSWRSSPAIIHTVNEVFLQAEYKQKLPAFAEHETHHQTLAGKVEVLPLWRLDDIENNLTSVYCRNPLQQPRPEATGIHQKEAQQIAQHIQQLVQNKTAIEDNGQLRPVDYNDIFILIRKRAHVADYERALRETGIAYLGTNRGTFLSCLEIEDMEALLDTLLTPFNNLALAQVLKSPLFSATDDDLQLIAQYKNHNHWFDRLEPLAVDLNKDHPIHRAWHYLTKWRSLTDKIPVHDLLDKIFAEGDVLERYQRMTPEPLQSRVQANLIAFLEMALDLDSGRYPSLMHFLFHLRSLKNTQSDAPDEAPMETREPRVRIMTIHASKGLEAPVVYLADTVSVARDKSSLSTLVNWPVESKQPENFQLIPSSKQQDSITAKLNQLNKEAQQKEDANLLYVAITRARQFLFISGCMPDKGPFTNWYQPIFIALQTLTGNADDQHLIYTFGDQQTSDKKEPGSTTEVENKPEISPALTQKLSNIARPDSIIAPSYSDKSSYPSTESQTTVANSDDDALQRGIAIHRMLELLNKTPLLSEENLLQQIRLDLQINDSNLLKEWLLIALNTFRHKDLEAVFNPQHLIASYDECPLQYMQDGQLVYGFIDRLVITRDDAMIIDYKTHQHAQKENLHELSQAYQQQMQLYANGVKQLWPEKNIKARLLFTECASLYSVDLHN